MGHKCKCGVQFLFVSKRNYNESAFNGYHRTYSDYSAVHCAKCGHYYRTKAAFVGALPNAPDAWWNMSREQLIKELSDGKTQGNHRSAELL